MKKQELCNRIYEATRRSSAAYLTHNAADLDYWREQYAKLTEGMPKKRIYKLMDAADLSYRVVIDTECDAIIRGEN